MEMEMKWIHICLLLSFAYIYTLWYLEGTVHMLCYIMPLIAIGGENADGPEHVSSAFLVWHITNLFV